MRFAFIGLEKATLPVAVLCRTLGVSRSGFYAWCERGESAHTRVDRQLRVRVCEAHERSRPF